MNAYDFSAAERKVTLAGVMIVFLLSALDQTIVSTAMPVIISDLGGLELYSWMITSYLLASTVMVPVWGKLGDLYGRKPILLWGIGLFLVGSWLAGLAGEFGDLPLLGGGMTQLIAFRALQGLGGGALFTTAFAIIADMFPPRERGRFAGLFGAVFGLASAIGPLIGGYFTDHGTVSFGDLTIAGWRWVFYLNLPLGLIALFMVIAKMPKLSHAARGTIDYLGAIFIVSATVPLLLALTFGGHQYAWTSPQVLGLLALFAVSTGLFIWAETRASDPIIHLELFANRVFTWGNIAAFFSSMAFLSVVAFLPLFMQLGQGLTATTSGLAIMPLMIGLILSATVCGRLISRTGRYKPFLLGGLGILLVGVVLLSQMGHGTTRLDLAWRMVLLGVGLGPLQSTFGLAIQNAVPPQQIGVVTGANQFFRQIGSTVGVALFGTVLTNRLNGNLADLYPGLDLSQLRGMAMEGGAVLDMPEPVKAIISDSVTSVFALGIPVVVVSLVATLLIPELPMRDMKQMLKARADEGDPPPEAHV